MRVPLAVIVVLSVTLPRVGEANPITLDSLPTGVTVEGVPTASADAGAGAGYSSLFDASGDPILQLYASNTFDPPGSHDKLRSGPGVGRIVFAPVGGPWLGSWGGFGGGSWGGGSNGGPSGFGSFTVLSFGTLGQPPNSDSPPAPSFGFGPGLDVGFGAVNTLSFEACCDDEIAVVPEPASMLLVGGGLLLGLKRAARSRSAAATTRS
jgi:hypothetical protein